MALTMSLSQAVPTKVSNVAISSTAAAASSSSSSGSSARVSARSLLLTRSMWGTKLALKAAPVGYTTQRVSASPVAILLEDEEEESAEEITAAYEALYGKAFGGLKQSESNEDEEEEGQGRGRRGRGGGDDFERGGRRDRGGKEFEERVVQIRRVTKVVKGGKQLSFRAVVVIGDKRGKVGVGVGKAKEVIAAVQKSATDARRHLVTVPMTKYLTFPHRADGQYGAAKVMLRPAATGTGVIAGGSVRVVLELAGVENALGKELGSKNPLNNARAVVEAVLKMKQFKDVARDRGIPMEELWK